MRAVFTRRHHEIIASQISQAVARVRYIAETEILRTLVDDFCIIFRQDNRNFSSHRFRRGCSLPQQPIDPVALATIDWDPLPDTVAAPTTWLPYQIPDPTPAVPQDQNTLYSDDIAAIRRASVQDLAHLFEDDVIEDDGASDAD